MWNNLSKIPIPREITGTLLTPSSLEYLPSTCSPGQPLLGIAPCSVHDFLPCCNLKITSGLMHWHPVLWKWHKNGPFGASLMAQWLRIRLPMQGTRVRALVREDPTCRGATKPVCHNYWACTVEPSCCNYWARVPQLLKRVCLEPVLCNREATAMKSPCTSTKSSPRSLQLERKPTCSNEDTKQPKINK